MLSTQSAHCKVLGEVDRTDMRQLRTKHVEHRRIVEMALTVEVLGEVDELQGEADLVHARQPARVQKPGGGRGWNPRGKGGVSEKHGHRKKEGRIRPPAGVLTGRDSHESYTGSASYPQEGMQTIGGGGAAVFERLNVQRHDLDEGEEDLHFVALRTEKEGGGEGGRK